MSPDHLEERDQSDNRAETTTLCVLGKLEN